MKVPKFEILNPYLMNAVTKEEFIPLMRSASPLGEGTIPAQLANWLRGEDMDFSGSGRDASTIFALIKLRDHVVSVFSELETTVLTDVVFEKVIRANVEKNNVSEWGDDFFPGIDPIGEHFLLLLAGESNGMKTLLSKLPKEQRCFSSFKIFFGECIGYNGDYFSRIMACMKPLINRLPSDGILAILSHVCATFDIGKIAYDDKNNYYFCFKILSEFNDFELLRNEDLLKKIRHCALNGDHQVVRTIIDKLDDQDRVDFFLHHTDEVQKDMSKLSEKIYSSSILKPHEIFRIAHLINLEAKKSLPECKYLSFCSLLTMDLVCKQGVKSEDLTLLITDAVSVFGSSSRGEGFEKIFNSLETAHFRGVKTVSKDVKQMLSYTKIYSNNLAKLIDLLSSLDNEKRERLLQNWSKKVRELKLSDKEVLKEVERLLEVPDKFRDEMIANGLFVTPQTKHQRLINNIFGPEACNDTVMISWLEKLEYPRFEKTSWYREIEHPGFDDLVEVLNKISDIEDKKMYISACIDLFPEGFKNCRVNVLEAILASISSLPVDDRKMCISACIDLCPEGFKHSRVDALNSIVASINSLPVDDRKRFVEDIVCIVKKFDQRSYYGYFKQIASIDKEHRMNLVDQAQRLMFDREYPYHIIEQLIRLEHELVTPVVDALVPYFGFVITACSKQLKFLEKTVDEVVKTGKLDKSSIKDRVRKEK